MRNHSKNELIESLNKDEEDKQVIEKLKTRNSIFIFAIVLFSFLISSVLILSISDKLLKAVH